MQLAYRTAEVPGTGGRLRVAPEDFRVDEIPLYAPVGEGHHTYLRVWKRGIATFEAARRLASALEIPERWVAYAGLKDARAVTTQWMSVPAQCADRIDGLRIERMAVLEHAQHKNKLRLGHLRGNRFRIVVREAEEGSFDRARAVLDELVCSGAPNYFADQRFGVRLNSHKCGEAILRGDLEGFCDELLGNPTKREGDLRLREARALYDQGKLQEAFDAMPIRQRAEKKCLHALLRFKDHERAYFSIPVRMRQMYVSAYQSFLFNRIVQQRLAEIDRVSDGDYAYLHRNGAVFPVEDARVEQPRCAAFEISPSAPLFGTATLLASGRPGEIERAEMTHAGLEGIDFEVGGGLRLKGLRRSMRLPIRNATIEKLSPTSFAVGFTLPSGCFATSILREITKNDPLAP